MRKKILSEKNLVVVLFIGVVIIFSFAQEDTRKIEQMYFDNTSPATTSPDQAENTGVKGKTTEERDFTPAAQLR